MNENEELLHLSKFVAGLRFESLPEKTVGLAKLAMLNILGGVLISDDDRLNPNRGALMRHAERQAAAPRATVIGSTFKTSPELAALVSSASAMMAHGDDWSWPARTHLSAVLMPAALALAEAERLTGKDLITAFVAGWEIAVRVGSALQPPIDRRSPFTSPLHALATAAVTARAMNLDARRTAAALSIATDMGTGLLAQAPEQHVVMRTPLGGSLGMYAASLAREGVPGNPGVLGPFCRAYGEYDPEPVLRDLGHRFLLEDSGFLPKLFHFSTGLYPTIHGLQRYQAQHQLSSAEIARISCETSPALRAVYGAPPAKSRETTHFSLRLGIALALCGSQFRYADVAGLPQADQEVARLAESVTLEPYPGLEALVNLGAAAEQTRTTLYLRNGESVVVRSTPYPPVKDPHNDTGRVQQLFMSRVAPRWGESRAHDIVTAIDDLPEASSVDDLLHTIAIMPR